MTELTLEDLNEMLARSGPLVAAEIVAQTHFPARSGLCEEWRVAYRRWKPTFPNAPYVVHNVNMHGAHGGVYDLELDEAVANVRF